jgi:hypothetical protein
MRGPKSEPTVRILLVETEGAQAVYEGFGSWSQCERLIVQISGCEISGGQLAAVKKRLELNRLASIQGVLASLQTLDSVGHPDNFKYEITVREIS